MALNYPELQGLPLEELMMVAFNPDRSEPLRVAAAEIIGRHPYEEQFAAARIALKRVFAVLEQLE